MVTRPRSAVLAPLAVGQRLRRSHLPPPPHLAPYIAVAWMLEWSFAEGEAHTLPTIPNPCVQIIVDGESARLLGVVTTPFAATLRGEGFVFGLRFRAGGFFPFSRQPQVRLADRTLPLRGVLPQVDEGELRRRASHCDGPGILEALVPELSAVLQLDDPLGDEVREMAERIARDGSVRTVAQAARIFSVSTRTLQRLFRTRVGVSPGWMIRQYRLQEAAARVEAGEVEDWPKLALDLGYFDQSHFINDFTRAVGRPPGEFASRLGMR